MNRPPFEYLAGGLLAFVLACSGGSGAASGGGSTPPPAPSISSFSAAPAVITAGGSSTLSWATANATALSINQAVGTVNGSSGTKTVSPTTTTTFTLTATNSSGSVQASATVTVNPVPVITISPSTLAGGTVGAAYSQTLTATGGTSPYTFSVSTGAVPAGLSLSSVGSFSGIPVAAGTASFTVRASDAASNSGSGSYTLTILAAPTGPLVRIGGGTGRTVKPLLGVNAGPLPAGPSVTATFATAYQSIGVRAIRTHDHIIYPPSSLGPGPLDMGTMYPNRTVSPSLQSSFDFSLSDAHFAAIHAGGLETFFRLGDSAGIIKPPTATERANWVQAGVQVIRHYKDGQWNGYTGNIGAVEIWNEPDSSLFWNRTQTEFFQLYVDTAKALKAAFPTLLIGGPGFTEAAGGNPTGGWMKAFLDKVQADGAPLDFLSFHTYTNDPERPSTMASALRTELDARGLAATAIYLTEWNTQADPAANLDEARQLRSGARGCSIVTGGWIHMQDAPLDRLFHYRGSDPNANTPEDYGLYLGSGTAKRTAFAFQAWSKLAATSERVAADIQGDSNLRVLAGKDAAGKSVILVVNLANTASSWTPVDASGFPLTGAFQLSTLSDSAPTPVISTAAFPVPIPAYGVQVLAGQ